MPHKDSVLIIAGGLLQTYAVQAAHSLKLRAIVTDGSPDCPCLDLADEFHEVDIYDVPGHLELAEKLRPRLCGVFTAGADCEVTVAEVAEALGLLGIPVVAALNCKNKVYMRRAFDRVKLSWVRWQ